jgi:nucleoside-diphosphate-sugar epimerase
MRIAVTGASGFIGRAVVDELSRRGIEVVACARSSLDAISAHSVMNVLMDLHTPPSDAFEQLGCPDVLIHLAWGGLPNYRSLHHIEQELPAQYRFLSGLIDSGLRSLVVAGTCFEYGMQSGPLSEDLPTRPDNPYGFAKDVLRRELKFLQVTRSFALTWARLFYLYGEGQAETSLLPQLRKAVSRGEKIFNMSGGEQLRDYLAVEEAAAHLVALAIAGRDAGPVNVCSGRPISVRRLVEGWLRDKGWEIELNLGHYPYPDYEPMAFWGMRDKLDGIMSEP